MKLVELDQFMCEHGTIPTDLGWKILVLIPKDNTDTQGIRLLEILWKVVEAVIDTYIKKEVMFRDVLYGFFSGRVTGTDIIDLNLVQELARVDQEPLFLVFLHFYKSYDNLDRGRLLQTLER